MRKVNHPFLEEIWKFDENPENPDKFPENKIIISYVNRKPLILSRNKLKTLKYEDLRSAPSKKSFLNFGASLTK